MKPLKGYEINNGDKYSNEWYTSKYFFDAFPDFDLDPCAPIKPLWKTAKNMHNIYHDGEDITLFTEDIIKIIF